MRISGWGILTPPSKLLWPESQTRYIISAYYLKVSRDLIAIFLPLCPVGKPLFFHQTRKKVVFLDACFNMANCMEMFNSWSIKLSCFKQDAVHSTALILSQSFSSFWCFIRLEGVYNNLLGCSLYERGVISFHFSWSIIQSLRLTILFKVGTEAGGQ